MILLGDCLAKLAEMEENSVDAIVTDPPYGLSKQPDIAEVLTHWLAGDDYHATGGGFMGKSWDSFVPGPATWRECYRVLKPGGYMLVFASSRTSDLMGISIRLAGFEIRDSIIYCYGSGFPKSLSVSKALDKMGGRIGESVIHIKREIRDRYKSTGMTLAEFNAACGFEASGYLRESSTWESVLPSRAKWDIIKSVVGCGDELDALFDEAEREVIGKDDKGKAIFGSCDGEYDITTPATDAARQWDGWGTALKPAHEPIVMARKPLSEKTVAANVLRWGCGAVNIDASRIGTEVIEQGRKGRNSAMANGVTLNVFGGQNYEKPDAQGRWPSNLILGHAPGCVRRGEKRVRGVQKAAGSPGFGSDRDDNYELGTGREYGPEETVADWDCVEGCPVKMIGEQSGNLKSGGSVEGRGKVSANPSGMFGLKGGQQTWHDREGTAARFFLQIDPDPLFYCAKASRAERNRGLEGMPESPKPQLSGSTKSGELDDLSARWLSKPMQNIHPTVKPLKLMRYLVRLVAPPGGTVLDPFAGSGTTLVAAKEEGFRYIGIELEPEYVEIAEARLAAAERPPATLEDFAP